MIVFDFFFQLFEVFEVKELILRDMPVRPKSDVDPFSLGLLPSSITLLTIMNMSQFGNILIKYNKYNRGLCLLRRSNLIKIIEFQPEDVRA